VSRTAGPGVPDAEALLAGVDPTPALEGGHPVRERYLPVALPWIGELEKRAVAEVLDSGWMTTGAKAIEFGRRVAEMCGAPHGLALNSCTGALHLSLAALGVGPGDEVITSTWTFCSTVNVILHQGARPVLVDVSPDTLNLDPEAVAAALTPRTRVLLPVHFGGHPADMDPLLDLARARGLAVVEDAAHALGARYRGRPVGALGDATCFSFYAIKNITTGEGGALVTADPALFERAQILSLHGISKDAWKRYSAAGSWYYEVTALGFKYNLTDLAAAVGLAQLERWPEFHLRRRALAARYDAHFAGVPEVRPLGTRPEVEPAHHLYPVLLDLERLSIDRARFLEALRAENIGTTVNFIPVHLHPYYREHLDFAAGRFPVADAVYPRIATLPLYPRMEENDVDDVARAVLKLVRRFRR
jgi:dTDP-4-amino-4,6-dideoxygalactose transaminase